ARVRPEPPREIVRAELAVRQREERGGGSFDCCDVARHDTVQPISLRNTVAEEAITMEVPARSSYVVVGAGIHGLSTAYHLAKELRSRGLGSGADVVVLDKTGPGAGASGIACGVVRNNYFQPAMSELMQACVEVWESDPVAYAYNPVGYMALGAAVQ